MDSTIQSVHSNNTTGYFNNSTIDFGDTSGHLIIYQSNVEGLSEEKCVYLEKECCDKNVDVVLLQETHITQEGLRSQIRGFTMVTAQHHKKFGIATYVKDNLLPSVQVLIPENVFYTIIKVDGHTIVNVYKPPSLMFENEVMPRFEKPCYIGGDVNSHNSLWGYNDTNQDGLKVADWMMRDDLTLLYNSTDPGTFRSARWNQSYSPDLCFVSKDENGNSIPTNRRILRGFPNSQHRPIVIEIGLKVPLIRADGKNRWNFNKANWESYNKFIEQTLLRIPSQPSYYDRFVGLITSAAKRSIPRGRRDTFVPGWSEDSKDLLTEYQRTGNTEIGNQLLRKLDENRKSEWEAKMSSVDFAKSSKKAWNLINRLSGKSTKTTKIYPVSPEQITAQLVKSSKGAVSNAQQRKVNREFKSNFRKSQLTSRFSAPFTVEEICEAVKQIECRKAPGKDKMFPEFIKHLGPNAIRWLSKFFTNVYVNGTLPKMWKMAVVIAFPKPNKTADDPANYRPISLLSCFFKLFERSILARLRGTIDESIPNDQAGFRENRNCCDQVLSLTNYIELGFEKGLKTGVVFLDLSAAYDTVWKKGLLMKLSKIVPCQKTLNLFTNMLSDRSFQVEINDKSSRKRILNDGLPQGSVLSCYLYCPYTSDLRATLRSRRFIYADDIALAAQSKTFEGVEKSIRTDLRKLAIYFTKWRLKPNVGKTVSCLFHLNNRQANRRMKLKMNGKKIKHENNPKYLGVILDRSLTYRKNLENTKKKLKSRINIIQKLTGTTWGCSAKTLRITTQAMIMPIADYCSTVWMDSCHTNRVDTQINVALTLVCGAVQSTQTEWLHVLANIAPPHILREESAIRECRKIEMNQDLPLYRDLMTAPATRRLKSRSPFWNFFRDYSNMNDKK